MTVMIREAWAQRRLGQERIDQRRGSGGVCDLEDSTEAFAYAMDRRHISVVPVARPRDVMRDDERAQTLSIRQSLASASAGSRVSQINNRQKREAGVVAERHLPSVDVEPTEALGYSAKRGDRS